jgi:hypothetical protein
MKIYKVHICLSEVIARLKKYDLEEYNSSNPIIFVEASDPDGACYKTIYNFAQKITRKDHSIETLEFVKDLFHDIRVIKIELANEKKL